jgi:hypothetical protein
MNSDTQNIDDNEKLNIIFKEILGFPSTSEKISYYEEVKTNFNTYTLGENVLLENITQYPNFDTSGNVKSANEIGLKPSDFYNYYYNPLNKAQSSIVDDSTGTVRRFKYLKLEQTYGTENSNYGASWFKLDISYNNVLEDSLQYNYKSYYDLTDGNALKFPYLYEVFTENSLQASSVLRNLPFGIQGGNWIYNYKNGILFFSDFNNLAQQNIYGGIYNITNNNKPVISVYKYIGKKNINTLIRDIDNLKNSSNINPGINNIFTKLLIYTQNLTNKISKLEDTTYTNTSNKIYFTNTNFTTTTTDLIDLSNLFFNTITIYNTNNSTSNILVNINATLYCSHVSNERITVQVWRDLSMIVENRNLGSAKDIGGLTIPYNLTYLDENISCGIKKYYLKYQLESRLPGNHPPQGIINVRTSLTQGSSDIILREIKTKTIYNHTIIFSNKLLFGLNKYTTTSDYLIDLSNSFFNIINPCNTIYILINVNLTLACSYAYNERITIELWRDLSMIMQDSIFGSVNATSGSTMSYSFTYLDENFNNSPKKYYIKYKLDNNNSNQEQGIVNVRTSTINGSSNILLKDFQNIYNFAYNNSFNYNNIYNTTELTSSSLTTSTNNLMDLSNSFYNIINPCNNSNILVNVKASLYCSYAYNERITIELWRDLSMLTQDCSLGTLNAAGGLNLSYNMTYYDENINSGPNKYYLKYKLDNNNSAKEQGLININTNNNNSSSRIFLREITNVHNISSKTIFNNTNFTTTTNGIVDLSNSFYNTININNNNTNVLVNIKTTLYCSYAYKERITIELWRDSTMIIQDCSIGIINGTNGLTIPYNLTYLDENISSGLIKYYLKYKLENNISGQHMGLINIKTTLTNGSSSIILRQI